MAPVGASVYFAIAVVASPFVSDGAVSTVYPLRHSTFLVPGAPRPVWTGVRLEL